MYSQRKAKQQAKVPQVIIIDDREKMPWPIPRVFKVKTGRLVTGDYSFEGYEHICAIEKKSGFEEFVQNISGQHRERFKKSLERLAQLKYKAFVIEANIGHAKRAIRDLPKTRLSVESVYYWLAQIQVAYGIPVYLAGKGTFTKRLIIEHLFRSMAECLVKEVPQ